MSENIKFITQQLNRPPFDKKLNLITFDSLDSKKLLQLVEEVLATIESRPVSDIREEMLETMASRMMETLRTLRYNCNGELDDVNSFTRNLIKGERCIIYSILEWLLRNFNDLKKRAYLANYLIKLSVPQCLMQDDEISKLYKHYESLIQTFKETHKSFEATECKGLPTSEVKTDIASMQEEKEQLQKRVERMRKKIETFPASGSLIEIARQLRIEREREAKLCGQIQNQKVLIASIEQDIQRTQHELQTLRKSVTASNPEALLHRLQEDVNVNKYLVTEKLPNELNEARAIVEQLHGIASYPAMSQSYVDQLLKQLHEVNVEVNSLIERRLAQVTNPIDPNLDLFRQQAGVVAHRKAAAGRELGELREQLTALDRRLDERSCDPPARMMKTAGNRRETASSVLDDLSSITLSSCGAGELSSSTSSSSQGLVMSADELQRYVTKLRAKNSAYKVKRSQLSELRVERSLLARTVDRLKDERDASSHSVDEIEASLGMTGLLATRAQLDTVGEKMSELNQQKGTSLEDMSSMIQRLTSQIKARRSQLAPLLEDLRPLRQKTHELGQEHAAKKTAYDALTIKSGCDLQRLEQETVKLRQAIQGEESNFHYLSLLAKLTDRHRRLWRQDHREVDESSDDDSSPSKITSSSGGNHQQSRPSRQPKRQPNPDELKALYQRNIAEQERRAKRLTEEHRQLTTSTVDRQESIRRGGSDDVGHSNTNHRHHGESQLVARQRQVEAWTKLIDLFEVKRECLADSQARLARGGDYADAKSVEPNRLLLL